MNNEKCLYILAKSFETGNVDELSKILKDDCTYHSDYSSESFSTASQILENISKVYSSLDNDSKYNCKITELKDVLKSKSVFRFNQVKCLILCQYGDCINSVVTIKTNINNNITHIELSRDRNLYNVDFYDYSIEPDSPNDVPKTAFEKVSDKNNYIWKNANSFIEKFLREKDYIISESIPFEDCIGYRCNKYCHDYTVFMFAYGQKQTIPISGEFCSKLRLYSFAQNSTILIVYLKVEKTKKGHKYEYSTYGCYGKNNNVEFWKLKYINEKNILCYFSSNELESRINEFVYAYNNDSLDIYDMIIDENNLKFQVGSDIYANENFFENIKSFHEKNGDMKLGYFRVNNLIYLQIPYIENLGYFVFSIKGNNYNKIYNLCFEYVDDIRDFIIIDEIPMLDKINSIPTITEIDFPIKEESERFTMKLHFSNDESRKFYLPVSWENKSVNYCGYMFTDEIWNSARISINRQKPKMIGCEKYNKCGYGVDFSNGYSISNARCYYESVPYFDDDNEEIKINTIPKFNINEYEYENGYTVRFIECLNLWCLINKNTNIIRKLPDKYQNTHSYIDPACGGLSEGLIMVSVLKEPELQYHHFLRGCAGLWGWIDLEFNTVIEPKYIFAKHFLNGKAIVCKGEWSIDENNKYWCDDEKWGVIDIKENEVIPFIFDEISFVEETERYFFGHIDGWDNGYYAVYDIELHKIIIKLDFYFDIHYMFNSCWYDDGRIIFMEHMAGEEVDYIYIYNLTTEKWEVYHEEYIGRTLNGKTKIVINKDGEDIIVF